MFSKHYKVMNPLVCNGTVVECLTVRSLSFIRYHATHCIACQLLIETRVKLDINVVVDLLFIYFIFWLQAPMLCLNSQWLANEARNGAVGQRWPPKLKTHLEIWEEIATTEVRKAETLEQLVEYLINQQTIVIMSIYLNSLYVQFSIQACFNLHYLYHGLSFDT